MQPLGARAVEPHIVGGPPAAELFASGGQLPDEVGQSAVVGVAARFGVGRIATMSSAVFSQSR